MYCVGCRQGQTRGGVCGGWRSGGTRRGEHAREEAVVGAVDKGDEDLRRVGDEDVGEEGLTLGDLYEEVDSYGAEALIPDGAVVGGIADPALEKEGQSGGPDGEIAYRVKISISMLSGDELRLPNACEYPSLLACCYKAKVPPAFQIREGEICDEGMTADGLLHTLFRTSMADNEPCREVVSSGNSRNDATASPEVTSA